MSQHVSTERMNEAVDGLLSSAEMDQLEDHIRGCGACRNEYARLSEVVSALRSVPRTGQVPDEVWHGIAQRIETPSQRNLNGRKGAPTVVPLPVSGTVGRHEAVARGGGRTAPVGRTFTVSAAKLAVAACLVAVVSASVVWLGVGPSQPAGVRTMAAAEESLAGAAARAVSLDDSRYLDVVDQLEEILAEGRAVLAPETLVTIEESLRTVNGAIEDIETALADDPNSDLLLRMLATHRSTKLGVLQRAAAAVQAQI